MSGHFKMSSNIKESVENQPDTTLENLIDLDTLSTCSNYSSDEHEKKI